MNSEPDCPASRHEFATLAAVAVVLMGLRRTVRRCLNKVRDAGPQPRVDQ